MAQNAPGSVDVQDIQFKLHGKFPLFPESKELKSLVSLLAVSSTKGLLFAGNPNVKELKVIKLKDIIDYKSNGKDLPVRVISLPGEPKAMACSCDGSMLAVNYMQNNTGFLQIFQVDCFLTASINPIYNVPVSPESYVFALQLLWNPVIANNIALVLNDGSVTMFTLNSGGNYDKVTLGKENQVKSGCWSPKGKQIVFGFPDGKLQQFKPNLQPARAIPCPPGIHPGPFDCIAVHWLSTFQFAVIFLQRGEEMCPSLFIVNAPKAGNPTYINYYDICYSAPGPRTQQLTFNHISQWNLLLVSSANGVEVGILGTKETGENPTWIQYTLLDEARIEMPLTESKDETFPMGFVFDTASSHQTKMGEQLLPVMPMIHVLSTHGHLVSFNFLNLSPNAAGVCSPPPPLNDTSGEFKPLHQTLGVGGGEQKSQGAAEKGSGGNSAAATQQQASSGTGFGDMTFTLGPNMVTSTPAIKDKPVPMFGGLAATSKPSGGVGTGFGVSSAPSSMAAMPTAVTAPKTTTGLTFGSGNTTPFGSQQSASKPGFGTQSAVPAFGGISAGQGGFGAKPAGQPLATSASDKTLTKPDSNQPLYTVPPTFKAPQPVQAAPKSSPATPKVTMNVGEIDDVVKQMIAIQIQAFDVEIRQIQMQTMKLMENIGTPNEIKSYTKQLNDLQEIIEQADDHEFEQDVQSLRHAMNESYAMLAECRSKLEMYKNPNLSRLTSASTADPANRRQLAKLQAFVATNQTQLNQVNYLIDAQWSQYQDVVRRNSKNQMHIPCLDGIYQRMSKLKDLLARQRSKMNHIKSKLKQKGLNYKPGSDKDVTLVAVGALSKSQGPMESLADSILSMSLSQVVSQSHSKLSESKLNAIRNFAKQQQQISIIKPKRPDRVGLKSEVILETKLESERKQKEKEMKEKQLQQQQQIQKQQQQVSTQKTMTQKPTSSQQIPPQNVQQQQQTFLAKPMASKPPLLANTSQPSPFITPNPATSSTLSFGNQSSFVKTSSKPDDPSKLASSASSPFAAFATSTSGSGVTFGQPVKSNLNIEAQKENIVPATPISFSAKVIGGNDTKNKPNIMGGSLTPAGDNSGFAAFSSSKPANLTTTETTTTASKDSKIPDEPEKAFSFGGISSTLTSTNLPASSVSSTTTTTPFGGFGAKPASTAAATATTPVPSSSSGSLFSSSAFGSGLSLTTTAKPFAALSSESSTPFGGSGTTFSFGGLSSSTTTANTFATSSAKPSEASGVVPAKPQETKVSSSQPSQATTSASSTPSFSFGGIALGNTASKGPTATITTTTSSAPPNVTITSTGLPTTTTANKTPTTITSTAPAADSLFGSLNICKPDTKPADSAKTPTNIFSGFATSTSTSTTSSPFSFSTNNTASDGGKPTAATTPVFGTTTTSTTNIFGKPSTTSTEATTTTSTTTTTTTASSVGAASSTTTATTTSVFSFTSAADQKSSALPVFGSLSVTSSAPSTTTSTTAATTGTTTTASNIFGGAAGASSIFAQAAAATSTVATTNTASAPIFGGAASSSGPSLFGSTAPTATTATTPSTGSIFGSNTKPAEPTTGGSIFGGIPKPDQSVFGSSTTATAPTTGLFAAAAAATKPPGAPAGGSIFGGGSTTGAFGAPASGGSIFGGGAATTSPFGSAATAGSIFGGAAAANAKPAEGGNIFGSPTQQSASSGGSIFGKSTFGQTAAAAPAASAGNIFGGGAAATQSSTTGPFGGASSGGSIFGGAGNAGNNSTSGGSIFGGGNTASAFGSTASSGFGSFSQTSNAPAFGSPSAGGGFGATAFGSPQQSAFAKPVFGGPPTFGSPPAFGAQPTFGGAPTFGSPKGFGTFAAATSPTAATGGFGATAAANTGTAKSNIFETLGSTDTGLSFGNLAQSTQPPNQQKPAFGGSSFMSYR
ncbi:nuclear pore complex protein Nup214 [Musca autumnalis]|uniref:nuclear pore complex protein Nup214 n=1 Tax=Musca autumnalis TaxID=221902 RepID=UPI003CED0612